MLRAMRIVNLGCGTRASAHPDVVNVDWSIYLRLRRNPLLRPLVPIFVRGERLERFRALPSNIVVHNLARSVPFASRSVDVVYHSHLLEHLDRNVAPRFMAEVTRVLKPGGIQRIVVPDLERACRAYLEHLQHCASNEREAEQHDEYVRAIIEQCVRREARGTSQQRPLRRRLENLVLGDARRQGDTHQWMYDRLNLSVLLKSAGFTDVRVCGYTSSEIPRWSEYGLDADEHGREYKPESLYLECRAPN